MLENRGADKLIFGWNLTYLLACGLGMGVVLLVWVLDSDRGVWEKGIFFFFVEFSVVLASDFSGLRLDLG